MIRLILYMLLIAVSATMFGCDNDKKNPFLPPEETERVVEPGRYHGLTNGERPTFYFQKTMSGYPSTFTLVVPTCTDGITVTNNGTRYEGQGWILKQSDVPNRGMAVIPSRAGCKATTAHIVYEQVK